jgi:transcriptional regulator with XRE-family HTH domain
MDAGLTLEALADRVGFSQQHISEVERAKTTPAVAFVAAVDRALEADGAVERLLPPVLEDREKRRQERAEARRADRDPSVPCDAATHSEVAGDDEDVEPTDRRGLLGAAGAAALGLSTVTAAPAAASGVDPALPAHWTRLLLQLGKVDAIFGPRDVLATVEHELSILTAYRKVARGALRVDLMRVEARWAVFAAWLSNDAGELRARHAWADRAERLAREADYPDMVAFVQVRRSQWAAQRADASNAVVFAQAALRVPGTSEQTRARSTLRAAFGYALANDKDACERCLADAESMMERAGPPALPPWVGQATIRSHVRPDEARCWLRMQPSRAVGLYERVLREWPPDRVRDRGLHQARLAVACAASGELDRARAEGRRAAAIHQSTKSSGAAIELKRLVHTLQAA